MKALVFDGSLRKEADRPRPRPDAGEALIKVRLAGICRTDLEIVRGYMGFRGIPGHEFTGEVAEVSGDGRDLIGTRVVGEINAGCGGCPACRSGLARHCPNRTTLGIAGRDGAFAEYLTLPVGNLFPIPDGVPEEAAVFCEPLAAALEIREQVRIHPGDRLLILGDGRLGLLCAMALAPTPAEITLAGKHPGKMKHAAGAGARTVSSDELGADRWDIVVEASGTFEGFEQAVRLTRPRGTLVLKSTTAESKPVDLAPVVVDEITIVGSRCGRFPPALAALAGGLDPRPLITAVYPFNQAAAAFERARNPESIKVLLDLRGSGGTERSDP